MPRKSLSRFLLASRLAALFAALLSPATVSSQPRAVLDMRFPGPQVEELSVPLGQRGVEYLGDVDGDGFDDLLIGVTRASGNENFLASVIVYGAPDPTFLGKIELGAVRRTIFHDVNGDILGHAPAGDVDGDGKADFLFSSWVIGWDGVPYSGGALLIFGSSGYPEEVEIDIDRLDAGGFRSLRFLSRIEGFDVGTNVGTAGDLDGDGRTEIAISAFGPGTENGGEGAGWLYVIYGGFDTSRDIELSEVGKSVDGFILQGANGRVDERGPFDSLAGPEGSIAAAGDLNGDGYGDLAVGASGVNDGYGSAYIVLGGPERIRGDLPAARPIRGRLIEIQGSYLGGGFGNDPAPVGDVDGDGLDDLYVGLNYGWEVIILHGSRDWPPASRVDDPGLRAAHFASNAGSFEGLPGRAIGLGDWNGDGIDDFLISNSGRYLRYQPFVGLSFLIHGSRNFPSIILEDQVGTPEVPGAMLLGRDPRHYFGLGGTAAGDLNGDGRRDLLISAPYIYVWTTVLPPELSSFFIFPGGRWDIDRLRAEEIFPDRGPLEGGYSVQILGGGCSGDERIFFGDREAISVRFLSSAEVEAVVPAGEAKGKVDVRISGSHGEVLLPHGFEYTDRPAYPDLLLDPAELRRGGHRLLTYRDSLHPPTGDLHSGDLNADGRDDLFIGEIHQDPVPWAAVAVLWGRPSFPDSIGDGEGSSFTTSIFHEPDYIGIGRDLALPGDLDGDGLLDLVLGSTFLRTASIFPSSLHLMPGRAYVVFGRSEWPEAIRLEEEVNGGKSIYLPNDACAYPRVAGPGDLTGDGRPDLLIGYPGCPGDRAVVKLFEAGLAPGENDKLPGAAIIGEPGTTMALGTSIGAAGDLNGDGRPDFFAGASDPSINGSGIFYLVLGGPEGFPARVSIRDLIDEGRAVEVRHGRVHGSFGRYSAPLGDFNGDGLDDAIIGCPDYSDAFVLHGSREYGRSIRSFYLVAAPPGLTTRIWGEYNGDWMGYVSALGDVDGDGLMDAGISGDSTQYPIRRAYVIFGSSESTRELSLSRLGHRGFRISAPSGWRLFRNAGLEGIVGGDFDGDGHRDLAICPSRYIAPGNTENWIYVLFGRGPVGRFVRGEANRDGAVDMTDAIAILGYLFLGNFLPDCLDALDADDDGDIALTDPIYLLTHLFLTGPEPPAPYSQPGTDPTQDSLDCRRP